MHLSGKAAAFVLVGILAGCQVKPLYSEASPAGASMASVEFSEATSRIEQEVRNAMIFHASGGAGEPANPQYKVTLTVSEQIIGALYDQASDTPAAGRIVVIADYNLTIAETGETIKSGRRSAVALVDFPTQEFAKVRAVRDGENRAARELAEILRAEIAAALGRE
ncbi:MAG: hypothetical protein Q7U22_11785 [Pararhizobium sp.]|nr:hypothetical protein [Pararhizobium sp.]MDO9416788.1 hypothetical protein [Pararhizobium sp.]